MTSVTEHTYMLEDLVAIQGGEVYEVFDGPLVARNMSLLSNWVAGQVFRRIENFVRERELGRVWVSGQGYGRYLDAPGTVRKPDVSFVRKERLPDAPTSDGGYVTIPPDLAVKVVSPHDSANEVENNVAEFLRAGVPFVWVIFPESRRAYVNRGDGSSVRLRDQDEFSGEDVLSGFRCRLRDVLPTAVYAGGTHRPY
jgi:Uma2 family endonuclease